MLLAGSMT